MPSRNMPFSKRDFARFYIRPAPSVKHIMGFGFSGTGKAWNDKEAC